MFTKIKHICIIINTNYSINEIDSLYIYIMSLILYNNIYNIAVE